MFLCFYLLKKNVHMLQLTHREKSSLHLSWLASCPFDTVNRLCLALVDLREQHLLQRDMEAQDHGHWTSSHDTGGWTSVSGSGSSIVLLTNQRPSPYPSQSDHFYTKGKLRSSLASMSLIQWWFSQSRLLAAWENSSWEQDTACPLQIFPGTMGALWTIFGVSFKTHVSFGSQWSLFSSSQTKVKTAIGSVFGPCWPKVAGSH